MFAMTTHKKRLSAGATSAVLLIALVTGCGDSSTDDSSPSVDSSASAEKTPTTESTPSADDEATDTDTDTVAPDASDEVAAFCANAQSLIEGEAIDTVDPADAEAVYTVVADMTAQIEATVAPTEIADDWALFSDGMKQFLGAIESITAAGDASDPAAQEEMAAAVEYLSSPEVGAAEDNVDAFIAQSCEV